MCACAECVSMVWCVCGVYVCVWCVCECGVCMYGVVCVWCVLCV